MPTEDAVPAPGPAPVRLLERRGRRATDVTGTQAADFLHRMLSQDVRALATGRAAPACLLTREGKIVATTVAWRLLDRVRLTWSAAAADAALPVLERYVIADDVAFVDRTDAFATHVLFGSGAPAALARAGVAPPEPLAFADASALGAGTEVLRHDLGAVPAFVLLVPRVAPLEAGRLGARAADESEFDAVRVAEGVPAYGAEADLRVLPQEAGLEAAISWTKGCYLGQEPVVMARHRGRPPSRLVRVAIEGPRPAPGASLERGGRGVGRLTTVANATGPGAADAEGGLRALGFVRRDLAAVGAPFDLPDAARATVEAVLS